jgi:hypothetical protein
LPSSVVDVIASASIVPDQSQPDKANLEETTAEEISEVKRHPMTQTIIDSVLRAI